jgi:hypothetical protein
MVSSSPHTLASSVAFRISRSCSKVARLGQSTLDGSRRSKRTFTSVDSSSKSDSM